ncbi:MAG: ParB domain protein nuclease [Candidatus Nomurabacteria bacterium]|nr:ParB domain protein nuclease [Candidatus Nomurabacteria bacterium]
MKKLYDFSIKEVKAYAKEGKLDDWVFEFLHGPGINKGMAKGLKLRKEKGYHSWIGPINFPLKELTRCCGPEESMEYPEPLKKFNKRANDMVKGIEKGWEVPVLIVNPQPWPILSIRDGNHRYEALIRKGKKKYPTIFWFDTLKDRQRFIRKYGKQFPGN